MINRVAKAQRHARAQGIRQRLEVRLARGNIADLQCRAVLLGVFRDVDPAGPARSLDEMLGQTIADVTRRRMFRANVGEIFIIPTLRHRLRTEFVILAGLGSFDGLNDSVQQTAAENAIRMCARAGIDDFATVLLGAGSGQTVGQSLGNLLRGFVRGLADSNGIPPLRGITLCELDASRYREMRDETLRLSSTSLFSTVAATIREIDLRPVHPRADSVADATRVKDPLYLIVRREVDARPMVRNANPSSPGSRPTHRSSKQLRATKSSDKWTFRSSLLTAGGKATVIHEVKQVPAQKLERHLRRIESPNFDFEDLSTYGQTLAELVLPSNVLDAMANLRDHHLVIVNDEIASRIPWETMHLGDWAPSLQAGVSRRYLAENLSVAKWLDVRRLGPQLSILSITNPTGDLLAADREGQKLRQMFEGDGRFQITEITRRQATHQRLIKECNSGAYDMVHFAGHAFFDDRQRSRSGIVCADGKVLSGADLATLSQLPSLIFVNACEAARVRKSPSKRDSLRTQILRSVSVAEAYLRGGIANFIGTYWPVQDEAAELFAGTFYSSVLNGHTIGQALQKSRKLLHQNACLDWADYIHYGDYRFQIKSNR